MAKDNSTWETLIAVGELQPGTKEGNKALPTLDEARAAALGIMQADAEAHSAPPPGSGLLRGPKGEDIRWEILYRAYEALDAHLVDMPNHVVVCPVCELRGAVVDEEPEEDGTVAVCSLCQGYGWLPTRAWVQRSRELEAAVLACCKRYHVYVQRALRDPRIEYRTAPEDERKPAYAPEDVARIMDSTEPTDEATMLGSKALEDELATAAENMAIRERRVRSCDRVLHEWSRWRQTQAELRAWVAEPTPVVAAGHATPTPTCSTCGKAGYHQDEAGVWHCKRHAYALGLLAPPVVADTPMCSFCEQRPGTREFEGNQYCGPCAEAAELPPVAA